MTGTSENLRIWRHTWMPSAPGRTAWAVTVYAFNLVADTNYGYLNEKPASASLLDFLGPWPLYVVLEIAIIATVWALMTWAWSRNRRVRRTGRAASPTPPASAPSGSSR